MSSHGNARIAVLTDSCMFDLFVESQVEFRGSRKAVHFKTDLCLWPMASKLERHALLPVRQCVKGPVSSKK